MIVSLILTLVAAVFAVMIALENTTMVQATFLATPFRDRLGFSCCSRWAWAWCSESC
jgi:hypothetical protein